MIFTERTGAPFLMFRDAGGNHSIRKLDGTEEVQIGRATDAGISIDWDKEVSRHHADMRKTGNEWLLIDDGLSRNGTFVNGELLRGRRRLRDSDLIRVGRSVLMFRDPAAEPGTVTKTAGGPAAVEAELSPPQLRVLSALARPMLDPATKSTLPASNKEIAAEVHLSIDSVKGHLRALYRLFGVDDLPQTEKRIALVQRSAAAGRLGGGPRRP